MSGNRHVHPPSHPSFSETTPRASFARRSVRGRIPVALAPVAQVRRVQRTAGPQLLAQVGDCSVERVCHVGDGSARTNRVDSKVGRKLRRSSQVRGIGEGGQVRASWLCGENRATVVWSLWRRPHGTEPIPELAGDGEFRRNLRRISQVCGMIEGGQLARGGATRMLLSGRGWGAPMTRVKALSWPWALGTVYVMLSALCLLWPGLWDAVPRNRVPIVFVSLFPHSVLSSSGESWNPQAGIGCRRRSSWARLWHYTSVGGSDIARPG